MPSIRAGSTLLALALCHAPCHATSVAAAETESEAPSAQAVPGASAPPAAPPASPAPGPAPGPALGPAPGPVATPVAGGRIVAARPFVLAQPFESDWRAERPLVGSGWLLVVETDAARARVGQVATPVLFAGGAVAERLNFGAPADRPAADGALVRLVVLVPAPVDASGVVAGPGAAPLFFGAALLPEQVTAAIVEREHAAARGAGLAPPAAEELTEALARGGPQLRVAGREALLREAAALLRVWSPEEREQADMLEGKPLVRPEPSRT